jgi:hypothetical protein
MINQDQLVTILAQEFLSFTVDSDDAELPYVVLGSFARFLLEMHRSGNAKVLKQAALLIERLHTDGDKHVKDAATIGLLEGIQNTWENAGVDPQEFADILLPESRRWWNSLMKFWRSEIPYVGADIEGDH